MGSTSSKDKMHCNRYLNGHGPKSLAEQVENGIGSRKLSSKIAVGNQPYGGKMTLSLQKRSLGGYPDCDTIKIDFEFENGTQMNNHPNPGQKYHGLKTAAYVPNNSEGKKVLVLLEKAFKYNLLFTVATMSTGEERVMYSDVPLKTSASEGCDGYPDPDYLKTVTNVLRSKGIK